MCSFVHECVILKYRLQTMDYNTDLYKLSLNLKASANDGPTSVLLESSYASLGGDSGDLNKGRLFLCFWPCFIDIQEGCLL